MNRKLAIVVALFIAVSVCASVVFAEQIINTEKTFEGLPEEDKAVKTQIAKYSDTKIDFRKNMQEKLQDKTYDISFVELNDDTNPDKVVYANDLGDEFEYDIETGKLYYATVGSNIVEKTTDSIDIKTANKIALGFFPKDCNINEYKNYSREKEDGYYFCYTRHIGQYMTTDAFSITIGFDGSVVHFKDSTDEFDGIDINFDDDFIDAKVQEFLNGKENIQVVPDIILVSEGKLCMYCSCKEKLSAGDVYEYITKIPLEG